MTSGYTRYAGGPDRIARASQGHVFGATLTCVTAFALVHAVQGPRTAVMIAVLSLGIHGIVRLTGDLYTAMALHF